MTQLESGFINVGNNTPTGAPMMIAVDNPYLSKDEFVNSFEGAGLGITVDSPQYSSGELDRKILQASSWINRQCRRWFDTQTIDEQKTGFTVRPYNPQLVTVILDNSPYANINSIFIQVLKWFIPVLIGPEGYLQDFYAQGFYKIVPLLSTAGTGLGSPLPAAIVDRIPLGVLWTNYTFGYGTPLFAQTLTQIGKTVQWQAPLGNRLFAPSQPFNVYDSGVLLPTTDYTVDYPNGMVSLSSTYVKNGVITADFTTNESIPLDIKEATLLLTAHLIGQAGSNPTGAQSMSIQTFSINWGQKSDVKRRVEEMIQPYVRQQPMIF